MLTLIWKFAWYSKSLVTCGTVMKPVFEIGKIAKMMPYHRAIGEPKMRNYFDGADFQRDGDQQPYMSIRGQQGLPPPVINTMDLERPVDANCGELRLENRGMWVHMTGRVQKQRLNRFICLRDSHGTTQLVVLEERMDLIKRVHNIPLDSLIEIIGTVEKRPANTVNMTMMTGEIEVVIDKILDVATPKRKFVEDISVSRVMQISEPNSLINVKGRVSMRPSYQRNTRMATGNIEVKVSSMEVIDPNETLSEDKNYLEQNQQESQDAQSSLSIGDVNSYCERTHTCDQLRGSDAGKDVTLCGWLGAKRTNQFATIRDGYGVTQLLIPSPLEATLGKELEQTTLESVIKVVGTVCARPKNQVTEKLATGEVEVVLKEFKVLNRAKKNMPFIVREHQRPKESIRMKYRYIDLRFSDMQYRLRLRSRLLMKMREFLINHRGFTEIETPTLFRRTPGGAQEYVVPTRIENSFYSLVQSPQQLKQLLMVGAMDRYFQVARCYRDEGARPDRQPEFTQMDIELSFTDRDSIISLVEELLKASWPEELKALQTPFPVISYYNAMHWYGSDKPDLSFEKKLVDVTELITGVDKDSLLEDIKNVKNFTAKALVIGPNNVPKLKASFNECKELLKSKSKAKLWRVNCEAENWKQALEKALPFVNADQLKEVLEFSFPCSVVVGMGIDTQVLQLMGKLRKDIFSIPTSNFHFAWIVDFPLFLVGDNGNLESSHHPFTAAHPQDVQLLNTDPLKVRGLHFDLVLNGFEVGGGSIRIHDPEVQLTVLNNILKLPVDSLEHLMEALGSGAPPHGGIALGMDRLLSIMVGAESIRDVIAFPKGVDGKDPLSGAPCPISDFEKRLYHLLPRKT